MRKLLPVCSHPDLFCLKFGVFKPKNVKLSNDLLRKSWFSLRLWQVLPVMRLKIQSFQQIYQGTMERNRQERSINPEKPQKKLGSDWCVTVWSCSSFNFIKKRGVGSRFPANWKIIFLFILKASPIARRKVLEFPFEHPITNVKEES